MGDHNAPLLALLAVLAGLGGLLAGSRGDPDPTGLMAWTGSVAVVIVLTGSILAATETGVAFGLSSDHALAVAAAVTCAGMLVCRASAVLSAVLVLSALALAALVAAMAMGTGAPPWVAWARLASEPVRVFPVTAEWVTEGREVLRTTTIVFTETHRITSLDTGVFRVAEPSPNGPTIREWRLGPGDSLTARAGDQLTLTPGTRVRFEAGKRMPGVAESGVAWAESRVRVEPRALGDALGLAVTLAGGALVLVGAPRRVSRLGAVVAPLVLLLLVLGAASWGVYAAWLAPDLEIGASPLASIAAAPLAATSPEVAREVTVVIAFIVLGLLFASAGGLIRRLDGLVAPWASSRLSVRVVPGLLGAGALVSAVGLSWSGVDAEQVLRLGLGLGASAWAAPWLAGAGRGMVIGAVVGGGAFAVLWLAALLAPEGMAVLGAFPALVTVPLAAAVAGLVTRRPRRTRVARRSRAARVGCPEEGTLRQ